MMPFRLLFSSEGNHRRRENLDPGQSYAGRLVRSAVHVYLLRDFHLNIRERVVKDPRTRRNWQLFRKKDPPCEPAIPVNFVSRQNWHDASDHWSSIGYGEIDDDYGRRTARKRVSILKLLRDDIASLESRAFRRTLE